MEGYGLSEATCASNFNLPQPGGYRFGSVGRTLPGIDVRIAADGEVQVHGPNVFAGYYGNDAATRAVMTDDGWLATGDLGAFDADGFLSITGRKKDLIVTASGKNVAPAFLEDRLRAHWLVDQCVLVGDRRPYIGALITLDAEFFVQWKREHRKPAAARVADLRRDPDLVSTLQVAVDEANNLVSRAEAIRRFRIVPGSFVVGDELTPTQKVRRDYVLAKLSADVEALYATDSTAASR